MSTLGDPALARLWEVVAERLQRNGLSARGSVSLAGLDRAERFALAGLVGHPVNDDHLRIDLAVLDARLRATGVASGLVAAVVTRRGPLVDRPGERAEAAARRNALWETVRSQLSDYGLNREPWVEGWLESIRPIVGRLPPWRAPLALSIAIRCVARLPWDGQRCGRTELASTVAGSSHALDDGTVAGAMVLRAIALRIGVGFPETAAERRALWERSGVLGDEVSTTALTSGLRPPGSSATALSLRTRSEAGLEAHLTLGDLRRLDRCVATGTEVWVCENPRVLEAAMDAGSSAVVVCTSGNPTVVVTMLLDRLAADGPRLAYRGDFDWPGIAIANRIVSTYGARPWRMSKSDYEDALLAADDVLVDLPKLEGAAISAIWDSDLTAAMARAGHAVHEEALLDLLVADLVD